MGGSQRTHAVIVDATLIRTQRPSKRQRHFYSGKHKSHGIKLQIAIDQRSKTILNVALGAGSTHDFELFKSNRTWLHQDTMVLGDLGYLGIHKLHAKSVIPHKGSKNHKLSAEQKFENYQLASLRISVEHVFCYMKSFKILGTRYRNRRRRLGLRSTIISLIYNEMRTF